MNKIASPRELTVELSRLLATAEQERPSRTKMAADLYALAERVAAKAPAKLKGKKLEQAISKAYTRLGDGVQVNMMSIPKIYRAAEAAYTGAATAEGADAALEEALKENIKKYRLN